MTTTDSITHISTLATHTALSAWAMANDFFIVLVLLVILFLFAWYIGHGPFVGLLFAFYAAYAIYVTFPYTSLLPVTPALTAFLAHAGLYIAFVLIFFIILRHVIISDFLYIGKIGLAALSFLGAAFLIAIAYHVFSLSPIYQFTPAVAALFTPEKYFFWWFSGPAVGLLFFAH
ncbi:MAG: hypothetical protein ABSB00_00530 [Minisyncoccia bacterium]|jgi:hypothetical protein